MESSKNMPFDDASMLPALTQQPEKQYGSIEIGKQYGKTGISIRILKIFLSFKTIFVPLIAFLVFVTLVVPVAAIDNQLSLATYPTQSTHSSHMADPNPQSLLPLPFSIIGTTSFATVVYIATTANHMLGPLMGVTSVLWFIMRNDTAVQPSFSWSMFAIWFVATLTYLNCQARRVTLHKLYILITLMFSGLCLGTVALVQKGSIQGGLVTAIPPCISFAAYAVSFLFPDRRQPSQESVV